MVKNKFLLSVLSWIISVTLVSAQQIKPATADTMRFSLQEAIDFAQQNSLSVKNAVLDLESAKKQIWEYTSMGLPQVNGQADYQNIFKVPKISFGPTLDYRQLPSGTPLTKEDFLNAMSEGAAVDLSVKENITYQVSVSQLIFSGQYIVGLQATKVLKQLSEQALTKSKFDTRATVAQAYYMVLVSEEGLKILKKSLDAVDKTLKDMQAMNQQGLIESTDVDQIRVNKMNIENLVRSTSSSAELAYRLLKFQMGLNLNQPVVLTDSLGYLIDSKSYVLGDNDKFNINNNIDYKMMRTQEDLSTMNLKREKSMALPSLTAYYRHLGQVNAPEFNFLFPDLVDVTLSVPIFSSGMRAARVAEAKIALEKTSNQREQVQQSLTIGYQQAKISYTKALDDYRSLKESVDLSQKIYNKTLIKYKEGVASSLDLTQAQNQYLTTESNYYNAILNLFNAQTALERLLATE